MLAMLKGIAGEVLWSESFALASDADFTRFTRSVTIGSATAAHLSFSSAGPSDSIGMLLDNVTLSSSGVAAPVPEPESWALLLGGLALVSARLRRRRDALGR
jgi:hypothetical protein